MRKRAAAFTLAAVAGVVASAHADTVRLGAKFGCDPALSAGRIRCSLEVTPPPGARLAWVDALVVETPPFARALRTRVAQPALADGAKAELLLGLVASSEGVGALRVKARAVVCPLSGKGRCFPLSRIETLELRVGTAPHPP